MRTYENPNQRVQDGPKNYLLSEKAEQEFSKRERWFANRIFLPYMKDNIQRFEYDDNLSYFMISVLWRVLLDQLKDEEISIDPKLNFLSDVQEEWREFLSDLRYPMNFNDLNIFLTSRIESHNSNGINVDLYMSRIIDATIVINDDYSTVAVYVKFLRFMIWSVVKGERTNCTDVKIKFSDSNLVLPQELKDNFFGGFIQNRISQVDDMEKPNSLQQEKIIAELKKNETDFWNTDAGKSMISDFRNQK